MDINNFGPFDSDVWGTVSDWIILLVTIITGLLIWFTLKSQMEVQKIQLGLAVIENEVYRRSKLPQFEISASKTLIEVHTDPIRSEFTVEIELSNSDCKTSSLSFSSATSSIINPTPEGVASELLSEISSIKTLPVAANTPIETFETEGCVINGELRFEDMVGNEYSQKFSIVSKLGSLKTGSYMPVFLGSKLFR